MSYGLYEDVGSNLRMMGTILALSSGQSLVYGEYTGLYNPNTSYAAIGTWLVRDNIIATPIPSAAFLFVPALMGFLGFRRKLKNTTA